MQTKALFPNGSMLIEKKSIDLNQLWVTLRITRDEGMAYRDALIKYFDPRNAKRVYLGLNEEDDDIDLYRLCIEWPIEKTPSPTYIDNLILFTRGYFVGMGWD